MIATDTPKYAFSAPSDYRICVRGTLDPRWSDCVEEMQITTEQRSHGEMVTTLYGPLRDQAALLGVLNLLYDLHCAILLVEHVKSSEQLPQQRREGGGDANTLV